MPSAPPLSIRFGIDVADIDALAEMDMEAMKQALTAGAYRAAQEIKKMWAVKAKEMGVHDMGGYLHGIQAEGRIVVVKEMLNIPSEGNVGFVQVILDIINTAPHASVVEDGHEAFHLPEKIDWTRAASVKVTAEGKRYITVPFRHYTPRTGDVTPTAERGMMPVEIHRMAKNLSFSTIQAKGRQYTTSGQFVAANRYNWGTSLSRNVSVGTTYKHPFSGATIAERRGATAIEGAGTNPAWSASKFAGMTKHGSPRHESYMTLRVLIEDSKGWNIPAQAGKGVARAVARDVGSSTDVQDAFAAGIAEVLGAS